MIGDCQKCKAKGVAIYTFIQEGKEDQCVCPVCANKLGMLRGVDQGDDRIEPTKVVQSRLDRFFGKMSKFMRGYK